MSIRKINPITFLLFSVITVLGCANSTEKIQGFWVSNDSHSIFLFKEDTLFSSDRWPANYSIQRDKIITENEIYDFKLIDDKLTIYSFDTVSYFKSDFHNLFDHKTNELGFEMDLEKGFSTSPLSMKSSYHFIFLHKAKNDSVIVNFDGKSVSSNDFSGISRNKRSNWVIAVDKNILVKDFLKTSEWLSDSKLGIQYFHTVRNKPEPLFGALPWESVSFERIGHYSLANYPIDLKGKRNDFIDLKFETDSTISVNQQIISRNKLEDYLKQKIPQEKNFNLIETDGLRYGDFIFLMSLGKKIISEKRDQFAIENYNLKLEEIKYEKSNLFKGQVRRDSVYSEIRRMFYFTILTNDLLHY